MKRRFSSFFFLRSYVALAAAILVIALALDSLLAWIIPEQSVNAVNYTPGFILVSELLAERSSDTVITGDVAPSSSLAETFTELRPRLENLVGVPVGLLHEQDFAGQSEFLENLQAGEIVSLFDLDGREILYRRVVGSNYILSMGPISEIGAASDSIETMVIVSYYVLVAIILFLWVRPFYRDLSALRYAASQFGRNDFSSRVEVETKSSIRPVAESFNRMAERIQYLVTAHRDLTNAVSHELRTPLARFKFSMEILGKTEDSKKKAEYLASMKTDVQELEELIDEMLTYARLGEENLQLATTSLDVDDWLRRQVEHYSQQPIHLQYQFQSAIGEGTNQALFNPDMMARALHNILRNCLRYATRQISISGELSEQQVTIHIADDGIGIPQDKQESVFEPFARLDTSRDRQSGGYGLGLAIARRILQRHHGSIRVEDNAPKGARFVLQWPRIVAPVADLQGAP